MTNSTDAQGANQADDDWERRDRLQPDVVLAVLVTTVEQAEGMTIGITLTTPGGVVTGTLAGRRDWLDRLTASNSTVKALLSPITKIWAEDDGAIDDGAGEDQQDFYTMIHLVDARHITGGQLLPAPPVSGSFWRGRLSEVSGWHLGTLGPGEG